MLLFNMESFLECWNLNLRELGAMGFDTSEFVVVTFLAHCSDFVRWSTVVATG